MRVHKKRKEKEKREVIYIHIELKLRWKDRKEIEEQDKKGYVRDSNILVKFSDVIPGCVIQPLVRLVHLGFTI